MAALLPLALLALLTFAPGCATQEVDATAKLLLRPPGGGGRAAGGPSDRYVGVRGKKKAAGSEAPVAFARVTPDVWAPFDVSIRAGFFDHADDLGRRHAHVPRNRRRRLRGLLRRLRHLERRTVGREPRRVDGPAHRDAARGALPRRRRDRAPHRDRRRNPAVPRAPGRRHRVDGGGEHVLAGPDGTARGDGASPDFPAATAGLTAAANELQQDATAKKAGRDFAKGAKKLARAQQNVVEQDADGALKNLGKAGAAVEKGVLRLVPQPLGGS